MMSKLFSSVRQSLESFKSAKPADLTHPSVVKSNPAYLLLGEAGLGWSAVAREHVASGCGIPAPSHPYVFRTEKSGQTVHAGTIQRDGRPIAFFHLTRPNGTTTITYVPQELLLQLEEDSARAIPAIRCLLDAT